MKLYYFEMHYHVCMLLKFGLRNVEDVETKTKLSNEQQHTG